MKAVQTISKSFFLNGHMIEQIIEELGTEEDKVRYKDDFMQGEESLNAHHAEFGPLSDADHMLKSM